MKTTVFDQNCELWEITWGIYDANLESELAKLGVVGELVYTGNERIFRDPIYGEKHRLSTFKDEEQNPFLLSEITPSVYAIGRKK